MIAVSEATDPISTLSKIKSPRDAREFLGMSLREISVRITDTSARVPHHISRQQWCMIEGGKRFIRSEQLRQVESILADALMAELAYDAMLSDVTRRFAVRIQIAKSGRWVTRVFTKCAKCEKPYNLSRLDSKRCKRCIAKIKRSKT